MYAIVAVGAELPRIPHSQTFILMEVRFTKFGAADSAFFASKFLFAHVGVKFLQIVNTRSIYRPKITCVSNQVINAEKFLYSSLLSQQLHASVRLSHACDIYTPLMRTRQKVL
jgi:hypothetical protein